MLRTALFACLLLSGGLGVAAAQVPALPDGATSRWVVDEPEEIVTWAAFDISAVRDRLPDFLRFTTIGELAAGGVGWAAEELRRHADHRDWGISFLEIARMGTFEIDGRAPAWPQHGAMALWCARVAAADSSIDLGPGRPYLVLESWLPDAEYTAYMRSKGYYAVFGDVTLRLSEEGRWLGTVDVAGLSVAADCRPTGPVTGGAGSVGMQALLPPRTSCLGGVVRVAFAGHRLQDNAADSTWRLRGDHPLAGCALLEPSTFQCGYDLVGGAYLK